MGRTVEVVFQFVQILRARVPVGDAIDRRMLDVEIILLTGCLGKQGLHVLTATPRPFVAEEGGWIGAKTEI